MSKATPSYRKHKVSGQAVVTINGKDHYLGPHGTKASKLEYDRLIAEWLGNGRNVPFADKHAELTVAEVMAAYLRWAKAYYRQSSEPQNIVYAFRPLKELYSRTSAVAFGPLALKAVRQRMIADGICRTEINKRIGRRIKRAFRWAVENELLPPSVFHGLQAVRGLTRGPSDARESSPVKPVPEALVDAIEHFVMPQVWAIIQLQRVTGMRPGEVTIMRTCDIDTSGKIWLYAPPRHKTGYHGHRRQIYLGPRAQAILVPWLKMELDAFLFSPREAMEVWRAERTRSRRTPLSCGNRVGTNRQRNPASISWPAIIPTPTNSRFTFWPPSPNTKPNKSASGRKQPCPPQSVAA